jgi:REP-associated tyrosine transposase
MNRSSRSAPLFVGVRDYLAFLRVLRQALFRHDVELLSYCVMPNHWHLVVHIKRIAELSKFMHWLTTTHARRWHLARRTVGRGPVYKGRFLSVPIGPEADLVRVCRYVERNPLRAGLVTRAELWPWSSLADRARRKRRVLLLSAPFFEARIWTEYVNQAQTMAEVVAMDRLAGPLDLIGDHEEPTSVPVSPISVEN